MKKKRYILHFTIIVFILYLLFSAEGFNSNTTSIITIGIVFIAYFILLYKLNVRETYADIIINFYILLAQIIGTILILTMFVLFNFKVISYTVCLTLSFVISISLNFLIMALKEIIKKAKDNQKKNITIINN